MYCGVMRSSDVRSSVDSEDNRTSQEQRDIAVVNVYKEKEDF